MRFSPPTAPEPKRSLTAFLALTLLAAGCRDRKPAPVPSESGSAGSRGFSAAEVASSPALPDGGQLYEKHCLPCHSVDHLEVGPAALYLAKKFAGRPDLLADSMEHPKTKEGHTLSMPTLNLPEPERLAIADYVLNLPSRAAKILAPPSTRPQPTRSEPAPADLPGEAVFAAACQSCHELDTSKIGPALRPLVFKYQEHPENLIEYLKSPVRVDEEYPPMPPSPLAETELQAVADYLLSLLPRVSPESAP